MTLNRFYALESADIIWSIWDVRELRPHLSEDQAWDVLISSKKVHDCNYGFTWELLEAVADQMYPAPHKTMQGK